MGAKGRVRRGEVYLLDLSRSGSRLRKRRPVVIVQNDVGNRYSTETIVAAIRDRHGCPMLPIFVPVKRGTGGLKKDSVVDTGHLYTVGQDNLPSRPAGRLPARLIAAVDHALRLSLGLV